MTLYFIPMMSTDPNDGGNWYEDTAGVTVHGTVPTNGDDAYLYSGTCSASASIVADNLYVSFGGTLALHNSGGTIVSNDGTISLLEGPSTLTTNAGTVTDNRGTISDNAGTVVDNYGTISSGSGSIVNDWTASITRYFIDQGDHSATNSGNWCKDPNGVLTGFTPSGEAASILSGTCDTTVGWSASSIAVQTGAVLTLNTVSGVTSSGAITSNTGVVASNSGVVVQNSPGGEVTANTGTITTNAGTVTACSGAITSNTGTVTTNTGTITTNASGGVVTTNTGTITTNASGGVVTTNTGTITTNASGGIVTTNVYGSGVIVTNNGTLRIGAVTGGSGALASHATTNLATHTAGANVTLPSGGGSLNWW